MKNALIKFFVSRLGSILTPIIAGVVGLLVAKVATLDPNLAGSIDQVSVTSFVVAAILSAVNYITNAQATDGIKNIQAIVGAEQDGVAGPITYHEVRKAVAVQK